LALGFPGQPVLRDDIQEVTASATTIRSKAAKNLFFILGGYLTVKRDFLVIILQEQI
jgi:hypothetical protein